jgi:hypothetical protein
MGVRMVRLTNEQAREYLQPDRSSYGNRQHKNRLDLLQELGLPLNATIEIVEYNAMNGVPTPEGPLLRITHSTIDPLIGRKLI